MAENKGKRLAGYVPDYVVFDLETTGTSWINDAIIEISAIRINGKRVKETFSTLVNPGRAIPHGATAVNGITDEMVADAPRIQEALPEFLAFIGNETLVGHNIQSFDLKFVYQAAEQFLGRTVQNDYIDTLYMARRRLPQLAHHRLTDLAAYFRINSEGAHRALNDCQMNWQCYEKMGELLAEVKIEICPRCGGELVQRNGRFGAFWGCGNYPSCRFTKNI